MLLTNQIGPMVLHYTSSNTVQLEGGKCLRIMMTKVGVCDYMGVKKSVNNNWSRHRWKVNSGEKYMNENELYGSRVKQGIQNKLALLSVIHSYTNLTLNCI